MRKVGFKAAIVELKIKRLASEDKSMRITIQVDNPGDELVNELNILFRTEGAFVAIAMAEDIE